MKNIPYLCGFWCFANAYYLKKKKEWKSYYYLDYDYKSGNEYVFHYYEMMSDHIATINWYEVSVYNGKY